MRTIVVGDVHGCTGELQELLERTRFAEGEDQLILVGDLVARGPDSVGALELARRLRARAVLGNHERKLLASREGKPLGPEHERVASSLSEEDWRMLEEMPLWIDLPAHGALVVHAGVIPGVSLEGAPPEALLTMRTVKSRSRWSDEPDAGPLWGSVYEGPPHVIFGHNARPEPQVHAWATGLDTGCVYGGRLTALVLDADEPVPRGEEVRTLLYSVPAMRKYYGGKGAPLSR